MLKNSNAFYDFHMKDNFIFPEGVKKIRSELNEDNLIKDFYSKNENLIDLDKSFYSENVNLNFTRNTYSRALNSARNIKTNLSINSARIKSQN